MTNNIIQELRLQNKKKLRELSSTQHTITTRIDRELKYEIDNYKKDIEKILGRRISFTKASFIFVQHLRKNNKKGLLKYGFFLMMSFLIVVIGIFLYMFFFETGKQYILVPMYNLSLTLFNDGLFSQNMMNFITSSHNTAMNLNIFPDLITFFIIGAFYLEALVGALLSRKQGTFMFFSSLTYLNLILLAIFSFISQIINWFYSEYISKILINLNYSTFFISWFVEHSAIMFFLMWVSIVFINQIDIFGESKKNDTETELNQIKNDMSDEEVDL